jgi:hypothetical protein
LGFAKKQGYLGQGYKNKNAGAKTGLQKQNGRIASSKHL